MKDPGAFHRLVVARVRAECPWFDALVEHLRYIGLTGGRR